MELPAALASSGVGPGRAGVYRPDRRGGPVWLGLPVPALDGEDLVALAGFAASSEAAEADAWGPSCPEPALRAWGQAVADQLRGEKDAQAFCHGSSARPEGGERVLIARLIRRLKISDAPERFQALATGALRAALGVAATAWVPDNPHEPVIVSGEVPGLAANGYRAVVPPTRHEPAFIDNQPKTSLEVALRRIAAVAADSHAADRLAGRRQPARRPPLRLRRARAPPAGRLADRHPADQRPALRRPEGPALRRHPRVDGRHRRQGPLHLGPLRAGGADRRPAGRGAGNVGQPAERPLPDGPAPRRRQDRHRRQRAQEDRPAHPRGIPPDPVARRDRRAHPDRPEEAAPPAARGPAPPREPRRHRLPLAAWPAT